MCSIFETINSSFSNINIGLKNIYSFISRNIKIVHFILEKIKSHAAPNLENVPRILNSIFFFVENHYNNKPASKN